MVYASPIVRAACCALGLTLSGGMPLADDSSALVQSAVTAHQQSSKTETASLSRAQVVQSLGSQQIPVLPPFDCDKHPKLCEAPFNCQSFSAPQLMAETIGKRGLAANGQANLRTWCLAPDYDDYIHACIVEKDLVKAAHIQYKWSVDKHDGTDELDGSYCFIEGHCTNAAVTNATTLEESYPMCDSRYTRRGWAKFGSLSSMGEVQTQFSQIPADHSHGFHDPKTTKVFLKAACAMGNYHCDVVYCKETYCKNPYYIKRYSHLLPAAPGHLLQSRDWLVEE